MEARAADRKSRQCDCGDYSRDVYRGKRSRARDYYASRSLARKYARGGQRVVACVYSAGARSRVSTYIYTVCIIYATGAQVIFVSGLGPAAAATTYARPSIFSALAVERNACAACAEAYFSE